MTRTINLGGKEVRIRATARIPFEYRQIFFADIVKDMQTVCTGAAGDANTIEIVERFLWYCAKNAGEEVHADLPVDDAIPAWLDEFEFFAFYKAIPDVITFWGDLTETTSVAKKNSGEQ